MMLAIFLLSFCLEYSFVQAIGSGGCTVTPNAVSKHTLYLDSAATSPSLIESYTTLFTYTGGCPTPPTCSGSGTGITVSSTGVISVPITTLMSEQSVSVQCTFGTIPGTASVPVEVVCGPSSVTFTPSAIASPQTFDLLPNTQPTFDFTPYTSSSASCPLEEIIVSDSATYVQSTHFDSPSTSDTQLKVVTGEKYDVATRNFQIQFKAEGGFVDKVAVVLTTQCVAASVPLSTTTDFPSQNAYIGGGSIYYQVTEPSATVTGCQPTSWSIGDSSDSSAQPTDLQAIAEISSNLRVTPSDATLTQTYSFYIWAHLPGGAESVVGPVVLQVGCQNYIDPTLTQASSLSQQALTYDSGNSKYTLSLDVDQTNQNTQGSYLLEFDTFGSSVTGCSAAAITTYALSSDSSSLVALTGTAASCASLSYTAGDPSFKILLTTSVVGTFSFYVYSKDTETRWDNERLSQQVEVTVTCGIEQISLSQPKVSLTYAKDSSSSINFNPDLSSEFISTKPGCPIKKYDFYKALPSTPWDLALVTISPNSGFVAPTLEYTGAVTTSTPGKQSIFVKGTATSDSSILEVEVVVCGNEVVSVADPAPYQIVLNSTGTPGDITAIQETMLKSFFSITNLVLSSEDCLVESFAIHSDAACSLSLGASPFSFNSGLNQIEISTTSPSVASAAYLCLTSKGGVTLSKPILAEVCGFETAQADSSTLSRGFSKNSGSGSVQTVSLAEYSAVLHSSNSNCPLASYTLVEEASSPSTPYSGTIASMTPTLDIQVSTSTSGTNKIYIEGVSLSGSVAFLEVVIEISEDVSQEFLNTINTAPFFDSSPEQVSIEDKLEEPLELTIPLPAIRDSHSNFCGLLVTSPLGSYLASNNSNLTEWSGVKTGSSSNFVYSFSQNTLTIKAEAGEVIKSLTLTLTLIDEAKATTVDTLSLTISGAQLEEPSSEVGPDGDESQGGSLGDGQTPEKEVISDIAPTAEAIELTQFGELTLEFSQPMKPRELEDITEAILNLQVDPFMPDSRDLSLTWKAVLFQEMTLQIQLEWTQPNDVSKYVELDTLVIEVETNDFFVSRETLRGLRADSKTMKIKVPRQLKPTELAKVVESTFSAASETLVGVTWAALALNTILSGFLNMMLGLVNSLQLIVHLPAFRIAFPPNALMVFESLIPLVTFDLLEAFEDQVSVVMDFFVSPTLDESEVPQQFQNVGFEDFRPLPNLGTLGLFVLIYLVKLIVYGLSYMIGKLTGRRFRVTSTLEKNLFYSEILFIFIEGYLDFCLASFLFLSWGATGGGLNWGAFALIASFAFVIVPLSFVWIAGLPSARFDDESFQQRWGPLFEDIRTYFVGQRLFFFAFILRRAAFAGVAFIFTPTPSLQLIALNLTNLSMLIYQGYHRPIASRLRNFIEATNEAFICLASLHLMAFTEAEPSPTTQLLYGWSLVGTVGLHILFNISIVLRVFTLSIIIRVKVLLKRIFCRLPARKKSHARRQQLPQVSSSPSQPVEAAKKEEVKEPSILDSQITQTTGLGLSDRSWENEIQNGGELPSNLFEPSVEEAQKHQNLNQEIVLKPKPKRKKKKALGLKHAPIHPKNSSPPSSSSSSPGSSSSPASSTLSSRRKLPEALTPPKKSARTPRQLLSDQKMTKPNKPTRNPVRRPWMKKFLAPQGQNPDNNLTFGS